MRIVIDCTLPERYEFKALVRTNKGFQLQIIREEPANDHPHYNHRLMLVNGTTIEEVFTKVISHAERKKAEKQDRRERFLEQLGV